MAVFSKLKQFKDMRQQGKKVQSAMEGESATAREFGDKVVMTMDGNMQISGLAIDESVLAPENKSKLENAIKDAHKSAMRKMQRIMASKMQDMGGLPGMNN
jgi:nucleoid-associated protein EbfC